MTRTGCLSQQDAINSFIDHQGRPYVTTYHSIAAYVVGRLDIEDVCPSSCHPDSPPGSIERVLSFVLHASGTTVAHDPMPTSWAHRVGPVSASILDPPDDKNFMHSARFAPGTPRAKVHLII
mgnify:CR=1 FL=1